MIWMALAVAASAGAMGRGDLVINELLYQPRSGEAEYVELYNRGEGAVELSEYHIVRWIGDSLGRHYALPEHSVAAHDYVVLTRNAASVAACYHVGSLLKVVECALPTYPNDGGSVVLTTADSVLVDRLDYGPEMQSRLLRNKAGVAIERRSTTRATNEEGNWFSASSTCGYGTPGYANSQSTELLAEESAFEFSSTLLSPDGDGYEDALAIEYRMEDGALAARVDVYDGHGVAVRRLLNGGLLGTHGRMEWDGRDEEGRQVGQGQYVVRIVLYDTGGTRQEIRRTVAVITPPPAAIDDIIAVV